MTDLDLALTERTFAATNDYENRKVVQRWTLSITYENGAYWAAVKDNDYRCRWFDDSESLSAFRAGSLSDALDEVYKFITYQRAKLDRAGSARLT